MVTIELLDLLSNLRMPSTGLRKLEVSETKGGMEEPMEQAVIEQFATRCENMKELKIVCLFDRSRKIGKGGLEGFAELAAQIIRTSTCLESVRLYNNRFDKMSAAKILTAAAASPSIEVIEEFNFSESANMTEQDACSALCDFLVDATNLKKFDMRW